MSSILASYTDYGPLENRPRHVGEFLRNSHHPHLGLARLHNRRRYKGGCLKSKNSGPGEHLAAAGRNLAYTAVAAARLYAYEDEVVFKERQRQMGTHDLLDRNYKKLVDEFRSKMEDYQELASAADLADSGRGQVAQQLDIRRLERVEEELMRLENDFVELQTSGTTGNPKFYEQRIEQLGQRQEELEKRIMGRSQPSIDLSERRRELDQLQRVANDMSMKLALSEVEASAPNRIEKIQGAVITSGSQPQAAPRTK